MHGNENELELACHSFLGVVTSLTIVLCSGILSKGRWLGKLVKMGSINASSIICIWDSGLDPSGWTHGL